MNRRRGAGARVAVALVAALFAGFGRPVPVAYALIVDSETTPASFSTETLDPPTNLRATATLGLVVTLTWTISPDARATGYRVLRATSSGGPFTQIATVTPRTASSYVDVPVAPATYWYVLRTFYGPWVSSNSNMGSVLAL